MSRTLKLLVLSGTKDLHGSFGTNDGLIFPKATLELDGDPGLLDQLDCRPRTQGNGPVINTYPIPEGSAVITYNDEGLQRRTTDAVHPTSPIHYTFASEFYGIDTIKSRWNKAVLSFILKLPMTTPIILLWG